MKICHLVTGHFRTDARIFQRQCKSLKQAGYDVSIITNDGNSPEIIEGISIIVCNKFWKNRIKSLLFAKYQFLDIAIEINADIYQLHSPELLPVGSALKKRGKIVIFDSHEDFPNHIKEKNWIPKILRKPISFIFKLYLHRVVKKFDAVFSPHLHVIHALSKVNQEIYLIANFPIVNKLNNFSYDDYSRRKEQICYAGTVYEYSNQIEILEAIKNIPSVKYEIAGTISYKYLNLLQKNPNFFKVVYHGHLSYNSLSEFYSHQKIGVVIYDYKFNLGYKLGSYGTNKIFEYMEAGLPFICTDYVLWMDIIDKYQCGIYVKPGEVNEIKKAILFLINNPSIAYKMGQNGRRAIEAEFNWKFHENRLLKAYENVLTKNSYCKISS